MSIEEFLVESSMRLPETFTFCWLCGWCSPIAIEDPPIVVLSFSFSTPWSMTTLADLFWKVASIPLAAERRLPLLKAAAS